MDEALTVLTTATSEDTRSDSLIRLSEGISPSVMETPPPSVLVRPAQGGMSPLPIGALPSSMD